jgi:hypothetical protein
VIRTILLAGSNGGLLHRRAKKDPSFTHAWKPGPLYLSKPGLIPESLFLDDLGNDSLPYPVEHDLVMNHLLQNYNLKFDQTSRQKSGYRFFQRPSTPETG